MKKVVSTVLTTLLATGIMTACSLRQDYMPTPSAQPTNQQTQASPQSPDTATLIGPEKAKEIALQKAGIEADGIIFDRVELDRDDRILHYEVEFKKDRVEYNAEIKADDGTILQWEIDYDD